MEFKLDKRINTRKYLLRLASLVLAGFCFCAQSLYAEEIFIVPSRATGAHAKVASDIKLRLSSSLPVRFNVHILSLSESKNIPLNTNKNDYIIAVGTKAFAEALTSKPQAKVLATLLPEQTFNALSRKYKRPKGSTSAVYLEQSVQRNLDLIKIALPKKTAGVLLGSRSSRLFDELEEAKRKQGLSLYLKKMQPNENLISALDQVLKKSNVLIAFSDPEVSNRNTAQHLLLTTYRHGIPVIAYSRAYVKAGALMAVYSTPSQYAHHVSEVILASTRRKKAELPSPQFPKYFSVEINQSVARSLGIKLKPKHIIESRLKAIGSVSNE